ncbi:type I 3-dehydroquinate dehydratase [Treponema parvum]|uniref:Shikimate dehydrogenase (NADP(+)) n=1 Tax=Treponema parvum TaxID=138851 RepID=A0A975IFB2_9SPIR|nr:type I 3-dehydroquinate dehydratase [Treponema parvum]QTQ14806.1 type I 3-dehydroquinate dehydratase [Treponema parvum]
MNKPLICLTLTKKTIKENVELINRYRRYIDLAELRADFLEEDELLSIRRFPELAQIPAILTIRRKIDGGRYVGGEGARTMLFARALAFAEHDMRKNFAYVDFEDDFYVQSLQDAALAFGIHIIRSKHDMEGPVKDLAKCFKKMCKTSYEIPKIACMPHSLSDVTEIFKECQNMMEQPHIICAMGPMGLSTRILAHKIHSYLTFVSPEESGLREVIGQIDPVAINEVYGFRSIDENTRIFGVTGWPLKKTNSPELHNAGYKDQNINAVYIPVCSPDIGQTIEFANQIGMEGLSVTVPHKESVLPFLKTVSPQVERIGACNTIMRKEDGSWTGYNTDATGLVNALKVFLGSDSLKNTKVSIIGAGGAAKAAAYAVNTMGAKACIFNRTLSKARAIAKKYGFDYAPLSPDGCGKLEEYSSLIIQTTSKGMETESFSAEDDNPVWFYEFTGDEKLFDIVYAPEVTPVMAQAKAAGCKVCNGLPMLLEQGYEQFKLFTGEEYRQKKAGEAYDSK